MEEELVGFFEKLPNQYRQETLSQFRQNGGTFLDFGSEFFVSVNKDYIILNSIAKTEFSALVTKNLEKTLFSQIGQVEDLNINFVSFENTRSNDRLSNWIYKRANKIIVRYNFKK